MSQPKVTEYFASRKKASGVASLKTKGLQSASDKIRGKVDVCTLRTLEPVGNDCKTKICISPATSCKSLLEYRTPKRKLKDNHLQESLKIKKRRISLDLQQTEEPSTELPRVGQNFNTPEARSRKRLDLNEATSTETMTQLPPVKVSVSKDELEIPTTTTAIKVTSSSVSSVGEKLDEKDVFTPPISITTEIKRNSPIDFAYLLATADYPAPISPLPPSPGSPADVAKTKHNKPAESVKLKPEEVKVRLGKCGKLKDLQARLSKVSSCAAQLKQFNKKLLSPRLSKLTADAVEVPVENNNVNENQTKTKATPAYQRFHNLASATTPALNLPYKYKVLEEMFRSVDTVVSLTQSRQELCTFSKLKAAVQVIMRRSFELHNLGQISHVFSEAYTIRQEKASNYFQSKTADYVLTVTGNMNYISTDTIDDRLSQNMVDNVPLSTNLGKTCNGKPKSMTSNVLLERRNIFHHRLLEIMKDHHANFLSTLNPPMAVPKEKLTRWHPRFDVDNVPDIPSATLPIPPGVQFVTAKDVLKTARGLYGARVEKAVEAVVQKQSLSSECLSPAAVKPAGSPSLRGIPQSLLDKIRAKEAANLEKEMTRDPVFDQQLTMKARLPELARILRTLFITEKKAAITIDDAVAKLMDSTRAALSSEEIKSHLKLLSELVPSWLAIIPTKKGTYLKIDKTKNLNDVIENVQNLNAKF